MGEDFVVVKKKKHWSKAARKAVKMSRRMKKYWAKMTSEERAAEMVRRLHVRQNNSPWHRSDVVQKKRQDILESIHHDLDQAKLIVYDRAGKRVTLEML